MKRILITGADSYIGTSVETYLRQRGGYEVDTVDMRDGGWREKSFSGYDTVFHVAGIAHSETKKATDEQRALYYKVNTDLTVETAKKAKAEGVGQFIFMSSAIIYGDSAPIGKQKVITAQTEPSPANFYGDSKLRAEQGILPLADGQFNVVILRPPMIYGKGSRGNYPTLAKYAQKLPFFPYVGNARSMLYVGNLCELIRLLVDDNAGGIFFPQNAEYSNTSELVRLIAAAHGKKVRLVRGFAWALKLLSHATGIINKVFGNLCYDRSISDCQYDYRLYDLKASVELTEK